MRGARGGHGGGEGERGGWEAAPGPGDAQG